MIATGTVASAAANGTLFAMPMLPYTTLPMKLVPGPIRMGVM